MKTRIFIVRHAETIGNVEKRLTGRTDYELTEEGKKTAHILAKELENIKFDIIYASISDRTVKTVEEIARKNKLKIIKLDNLQEMYFGKYEGWKWEDVNKQNPKIKENQKKVNTIEGIEGQETMEHLAQRITDCIKEIAKNNEGRTILIASHGVAIEAFMRKITDMPFSKEREKYCQHNCAINELIFENDKFTIIRLADINYINNF